MYRIYQFSNPAGEGEFFVFSECDKDWMVREWCDDDITLDFVHEIGGDNAESLVADRKLQEVKL